ncbi:MAG: TlyA family RNA methyltransferase [Candidatus Nitrospinota bacterium M3_3B_026]
MPKKRLDTLLVELGLAETRSRAQGMIMAGLAFVDGRPVTKAGTLIREGSEITVKGKDIPYVSRGGLKLEAALDRFGVDPAGLVCLDIGAGTGGFTDCLLKRGARRVWAVDVGKSQLDYRLRTDDRVVCLEGVNVRRMDAATIKDPIDLAVADVSFISLKLVLPPALPALREGASLVALVKPQFEAGPEKVGKGGVVRDEAARRAVVDDLVSFFAALGLQSLGEFQSPVPGRKGNIEYFIHLKTK